MTKRVGKLAASQGPNRELRAVAIVRQAEVALVEGARRLDEGNEAGSEFAPQEPVEGATGDGFPELKVEGCAVAPQEDVEGQEALVSKATLLGRGAEN